MPRATNEPADRWSFLRNAPPRRLISLALVAIVMVVSYAVALAGGGSQYAILGSVALALLFLRLLRLRSLR